MLTKVIATIVKEYSWIHWGLGLLGNLTFFFGSIFFLSDRLYTMGVWLFIIGSGGMLIGSIGKLLVWLDKKDYIEMETL